MENEAEPSDDFAHSFELNSLKDSLKINVSKSSSVDETADLSSRSSSFRSSMDTKSPRIAFPLSREALHEQLFGISETRKDSRSYSTTDVPDSLYSNFDVARTSPNSSLQMPKSSPGMIGASYAPFSAVQHNHPLSGPFVTQSFGEKHTMPTPPPIDVNSRYLMPPVLNVYNQPFGSQINGSYSSSTSAANTPVGSSSFPGKAIAPNNVSNPSIAISPSYHAHFSYPTPLSSSVGGAASAAAAPPGAGTAPSAPTSAASYLGPGGVAGRSSRISPVGNGRENPNLHYRPNRDVQIANLARAKAEKEAAAALAAGLTPAAVSDGCASLVTPGSSVQESSPTVSLNIHSRSTSSDASETAVSTTPPPMMSTRKPAIQYVYKVTLKTSAVQCLISPSCSLSALSMNELVVFQTCDEGSGALCEEIGFVSHIQTMKSYLDQIYLSGSSSNEQEAVEKLKQIIRVASEVDRKETAKNRLEEANIVEELVEMNNTLYHLPISFVDVHYQLDRRKLTVCYRDNSDSSSGSGGSIVGGMDGREMIRDLYQRVQTRIVMKRVVAGSNK